MAEMDQDTSQEQQHEITPSTLAELHGIAWQLQSAGDPRAARLWNFIEAQSGGGEAGSRPNFTFRPSPPQVTSWQEDLENELGDAKTGDNSTTTPGESGDGALGPAGATTRPAAQLRPDTSKFLGHLSGIGMHAYVAMRDPDPPEYQDWRNTNFAPDGSGNYVSRAGEAYSDDELKQIHGVLSRQAGNAIISNLFIGPKFANADYLVWRNQNFSNDRGAWEDEDGNIYSEPAIHEMFSAKFTTQPGAVARQATDQEEQPEDQQQPQQPLQNASAENLPNQLPIQPYFSPALQLADYSQWRNQNFRPASGGGWEAPSGRLYTEEEVRKLYAAQQPRTIAGPPFTLQLNQQLQQRKIEDVARGQIDSTDYEFSKSKGGFPAGVDKCNLGVADWIEQSGRPRPRLKYTDLRGWFGLTRDPSTHEWADPNVQIPGWSAPMPVSKAQSGDVIAQAHGDHGGHVGIILAPGQTISVNSKTHPPGIVTNTDWGFRSRLPYGPDGLGQNGESRTDPDPIVRRYLGGKK